MIRWRHLVFGKHLVGELKRALLDALDARYSFELPETLVEQEFNGIWSQHEQESRRAGQPLAEEGKTEDETRAEFSKIAERRVRLGLVLAEVGEKAGVKVTDEEVGQGVVEQARQFPGQEKMIWDYYQKNPEALARIRARGIATNHIAEHTDLPTGTVNVRRYTPVGSFAGNAGGGPANGICTLV